MNLSTKASLLFAGLLVAAIATTSLFLFGKQRQALQELVSSNLMLEANTLATEVRFFAEENLRDAAAIAGNLPVKAFQSGDLDTVTTYLRAQVPLVPNFENGLFLLAPNGEFLVDFPNHVGLRGQSFAHRDYYKRTVETQRGVMGAPYVSARTGMPVLTFTAPVRDDADRLVGILCASLNLFSPHALGEQQKRRIGKGGYFYIATTQGQLVLHPDKSRLLSFVPHGSNTFLSKALRGFEGVGETVNSQGLEMFVAARQLPEFGWVAVAQLPVEEALAGLNAMMRNLALYAGAALFCALPLGVLLMRRIVHPLRSLETLAQGITRSLRSTTGGEMARPLNPALMAALKRIDSGDEIGRLAQAFLRLSVRLRRTLDSQRGAAEDSENTFNSVPEALLVLDAFGRVRRMNAVAVELLRRTPRDICGHDWKDVLCAGHPVPAGWPDLATLQSAARNRMTTAIPQHGGMFELSFSHTKGRKGRNGMLLVITDVTEKLEHEARIRDLAFHDPLTRLPNRLLLADRLEQGMATSNRNGSLMGVLFLDLDDFKSVNDTYGHEAGDELLRQVARRLGTCLRANDTLARYAGDEFVVLLLDLHSTEEAAGLAKRLLASLHEPFALRNELVNVTGSIGIAMYPSDAGSASQLLNCADAAMYRAKGQGKNSFWFVENVLATLADQMPRQ